MVVRDLCNHLTNSDGVSEMSAECWYGCDDPACPYTHDDAPLPTFIQEDTKRLRELTPKLTPEREAANEAEHKIKRGEFPKW